MVHSEGSHDMEELDFGWRMEGELLIGGGGDRKMGRRMGNSPQGSAMDIMCKRVNAHATSENARPDEWFMHAVRSGPGVGPRFNYAHGGMHVFDATKLSPAHCFIELETVKT